MSMVLLMVMMIVGTIFPCSSAWTGNIAITHRVHHLVAEPGRIAVSRRATRTSAVGVFTRQVPVVATRRDVAHRAFHLPGRRLRRIGLDPSRHGYVTTAFSAAAGNAASWATGSAPIVVAGSNTACDPSVLAVLTAGKWTFVDGGISLQDLFGGDVGAGIVK